MGNSLCVCWLRSYRSRWRRQAPEHRRWMRHGAMDHHDGGGRDSTALHAAMSCTQPGCRRRHELVDGQAVTALCEHILDLHDDDSHRRGAMDHCETRCPTWQQVRSFGRMRQEMHLWHCVNPGRRQGRLAECVRIDICECCGV